MNRYYTHRAELSYALLKAILLDMKARDEGVEPYDYPEYKEFMDIVDPNDPDEVTFPLVNRWAYFHMEEFGDDTVISATEFFKEYGKKITNPDIKSMLAKNLSSYCMYRLDLTALEKYEALFKALAEKFKGNEKICFISLSVDRDKDRNKWVGFVGEEKPFWPQSRLADTNHNDFCDEVGISAIPRFLLIGPDGKFIDSDCARPSDENIEFILKKAIAGVS